MKSEAQHEREVRLLQKYDGSKYKGSKKSTQRNTTHTNLTPKKKKRK